MENLKRHQTTALTKVTKLRNKLARLMMSRSNEEYVSTGLSQLNDLFIQYQEAHEALCDEIIDEDMLTTETMRYRKHEADVGDFVRSCTEWLESDERLSTTSTTSSTASMRTREKAHLAALLVERQLFARRQAIEAERQAFDLDLEIAKAQAKEQVYAECSDDIGNLTDFDGPDSKCTSRNFVCTSTTPSGASSSAPHARTDPSASAASRPSETTLPSASDINDALAALALVAMAATPPTVRAQAALDTATSNSVANVTPNDACTDPADSATPFQADMPASAAVSVPSSDKATNNSTCVKSLYPGSHVLFNSSLPTNAPNDASSQYVPSIARDMTTLRHNVPPSNPTFSAPISVPTSSSQPFDTVSTLSLPPLDIDPFSGDVVSYRAFITSFDTRIGNRPLSSHDKLHYLHQFLRGEARELIEGCFHVTSGGYDEARRTLEREYGDAYKLSTMYAKRIEDWPTIKPDDPLSLRKFASFLKNCLQAMRSVNSVQLLDHPSTLLSVVRKLPPYLQNPWRERAHSISRNTPVVFSHLVEFALTAAEIANDPVFGKPVPSIQTSPKQVMSFSTLVEETSCAFCERQHDTDDCAAFNAKTLNEKRDFIKWKGLCFACYQPGHTSRVCNDKRLCAKCGKQHPTAMHVNGFQMTR